MVKYKGIKGPWFETEGWLKHHTSISSHRHGAFAQVVSQFEDGTGEDDRERLDATIRLITKAPNLLKMLVEVHTLGCLPDDKQEAVGELLYTIMVGEQNEQQ